LPKASSKVYSGGGFPNTPFLIGYAQNANHEITFY